MRRSWVVVMLVAASCGDSGPSDVAAKPPDSVSRPIDATIAEPTLSPTTSAVAGVAPEGFDVVAARVTGPDGEICQLCLWLAGDAETRARGLMHVSDLGGLDGMAFRYDGPHTTTFTMRDTVMPLSIAFFDADGAHLEGFDMEPCGAEPCTSYPTPRDFVVAIEVPQGRLPDLGIGAGSTLELLAEGCSSNAPVTT